KLNQPAAQQLKTMLPVCPESDRPTESSQLPVLPMLHAEAPVTRMVPSACPFGSPRRAQTRTELCTAKGYQAQSTHPVCWPSPRCRSPPFLREPCNNVISLLSFKRPLPSDH